MAKKVLRGTIEYVSKGTETKPVVNYLNFKGNKTRFAIDIRQVRAVERRFKAGEDVLFYSDTPFVAIIEGIRFVNAEFEVFYEKHF